MLAVTTASLAGPWSAFGAIEQVIKAAVHSADLAETTSRPVIPDQWAGTMTSKVNSTVADIPSGTFTVTQYYDYTNKRLRKDFSDGTSKMYDYKTMVDSGIAPWPPFPSPQGFHFRTDDIENSCCWLWLVQNQTGSNIPTAETMDKFEVESNAKDVGSDARGEHWRSHKWFPFTQNDDWWFKNGTVAYSNSYFKIPKLGYTISNTTFTNVKYGPIDPSVFAHPDSRPTFGKCKQCGVDSECPMWQCMQS